MGKVVEWYGTNIDLENRKRVEDALRDSETAAARGEVELVNHQVLDYFGITAEQLKAWSASDAVHQDDLPSVVSAWRHSVETGSPYDVDHRLRRADGVYRWFRAHGLPLRNAGGRIVRWDVLLMDIDEHKQAEEKLKRSEWHLHEAQRQQLRFNSLKRNSP